MTTLSLQSNMYRNNNRMHIRIWGPDGPYSTLTINIPEYPLEDDEFIMNKDHEKYCGSLNTYLIENKVIRKTEKLAHSGYQTYSVWKILQEIDEVDLSNFKLETF